MAVKDKTYKYDDPFKAIARAHQFSYREIVLGVINDERNPQVILTEDASKAGLNFCEVYESILGKICLIKNLQHLRYVLTC